MVAAAGLPRVAGEFERLTRRSRMFLGRPGHRPAGELSRVVAEVEALHAAIVARDIDAAERAVAGEVRALDQRPLGRLEEDFDDALWVALTRA